jgi:hypothetical protein
MAMSRPITYNHETALWAMTADHRPILNSENRGHVDRRLFDDQ